MICAAINNQENVIDMRTKKTLLVLVIFISLSLLVSGCGEQKTSNNYQLAPLTGMPQEVQNAPATVKQAYQFAVSNPEVLQELPCYCGCGGMGHTSNYSCYVADNDPDGNPTFDGHALGCSICVDITQDAMRMLDDGKSIGEIQVYVDQTYSRFGPSNMP
jgi:hypothetical protein